MLEGSMVTSSVMMLSLSAAGWGGEIVDMLSPSDTLGIWLRGLQDPCVVGLQTHCPRLHAGSRCGDSWTLGAALQAHHLRVHVGVLLPPDGSEAGGCADGPNVLYSGLEEMRSLVERELDLPATCALITG